METVSGLTMRLADKVFQLEDREIGGFYARTFRAIGQDLADLFPEKLDIHRRGTDFIVRGRCLKDRLDAREPQGGSASLKEFLNRDLVALAGERNPIVPFEHEYTAGDIFRLDEDGARRRSGSNKLPDIRSLAEMLRTIGRMIDEEKGRLVRIVKEQRRITVDYEAGDGTGRSHQMTTLELFKLQKKYYELRGGKTVVDLLNDGVFRLR